ncbi:4-oxalocrotonate decarboxylase [Massilia eurypsychrophila]|jgi:2-oxo-3-hexenedioate decarboxylase|uniref:4-oxalocrotonate decarboxylase n=1 Tax=Massilia eurypsychrophila TaxID=1485217 RepID=A0A2G8TC48_9BURK|nr:fumarylacetoacetate hydrolase family protein [Massilia eurypsychrophila]PIL43573.1 4-oxalocrotonate decarboxylase [Massilia eurypsychrophila]
MNLSLYTIAMLAERLERAELTATAVAKITDDHPGMDLDEAYAIQDAIRAAKAARGSPVAGLKMGLTSGAKIAQMGVKEPIYGFLNGEHEYQSGAAIPTARFIHPKVEAEIGFVLSRPLQGPGCDVDEVLAATAYVVAAVEIIDSRYEHFKFDVASVIADNTSAAGYVTGSVRHAATGRDLQSIGMVLRKNGVVTATATGADVLGHPAASVAMLANMLGQRGRAIPAGVLILSGGATEAIQVAAGDQISVEYQWLGTVSMQFT